MEETGAIRLKSLHLGHTVLLANYDHDSFNKLTEFTQDIPEEKRDQFQAIVNEGQLSSRAALHAALDVADSPHDGNGHSNA